SMPILPSVCLFSSRYLPSKDTALVCKINDSYLQDRTLALRQDSPCLSGRHAFGCHYRSTHLMS
ncbi:MAG: hypothetical protein LCH89_18485, partial [Proteobacteria bacterium]|nr:hypothetical protein [Pseudomonadota bacterium]